MVYYVYVLYPYMCTNVRVYINLFNIHSLHLYLYKETDIGKLSVSFMWMLCLDGAME